MLIIVEGIILFILIYVGVVFLVCDGKHITLDDSISLVNCLIKKLFKGLKALFVKNTDSVKYNFNIGLDGNLNPMSNVLDKQFEDLGKIFKTFYFGGVNVSYDKIGYRFFVSDPISEIDTENLYELCSTMCESIVHKILHRSYPSFSRLDSLTAVIVGEGYIDIYIAETPLGQQSNAILTNKMRGQFKLEKEKQTSPIEEEWGD